MRGIAISGVVRKGCIASEDEYQVIRNGKVIIEHKARLLRVLEKNGAEPVEGEAAEGNFVEFYLQDRTEGEVQVGDVVISQGTSCGKATGN